MLLCIASEFLLPRTAELKLVVFLKLLGERLEYFSTPGLTVLTVAAQRKRETHCCASAFRGKRKQDFMIFQWFWSDGFDVFSFSHICPYGCMRAVCG